MKVPDMQKFGNKLDEILADKVTEAEALLPRMEKLQFAAQARDDFRSLYHALGGGIRHLEKDEGYGSSELAIIAEVKRASPSAGTIVNDFDPVEIAREYEEAGASAISVLTDEKYFQGNLSYVSGIREEVGLPILRKDFIVHEVQIYESVVAGADAILLIVAALEQENLVRFLDIAHINQLDVLVEVHNMEEMERALDTDAKIIGVNNRNLRTFEVDLQTTDRLSEEVGGDCVLVSESGIRNGDDADTVRSWGADAVLVGEALMRAEDKLKMMDRLRGTGGRL